MKRGVETSVIVPCFNAAATIEICLNSVLKQIYKNFEIIVVNDASNDKTEELVEKIKDNRIVLVNFSKNRGASIARNFGTQKAKGNYLFFLDSDCTISKDCIGNLIAKLKEDKKIGAVATRIKHRGKIEETGHFLSLLGFPYIVNFKKEQPVFGVKTAFLGIKKNLFKKIGGFDQDYIIYGEDTDLSWRIWLSGYKILCLTKLSAFHLKKNIYGNDSIFFEGPKNSISTILKNADISTLCFMLPLHIIAWFIISLKLILQLRFMQSFKIYGGIFWNVLNFKKTLRKRYFVYSKLKTSVPIDIFGPYSLKLLFSRGWRWLKYV